MFLNYFILVTVYLASCNSKATNQPGKNKQLPASEVEQRLPSIVSQIEVPEGYKRIPAAMGTFHEYLNNLPLKNTKTVYLYNGEVKKNQQAQFAVIDISVGKQDLQQCADAVMRLRAEYFFGLGNFNKIIFRDNAGKVYAFTRPATRQRFDAYLLTVFGMCGTASLAKELIKNEVHNISAGDVFIRGGFPGHAVIVIDVAENKQGERAFMLAQSYMPAQDIHILLNPISAGDEQPWYFQDAGTQLITPEYTFFKHELKTWP